MTLQLTLTDVSKGQLKWKILSRVAAYRFAVYKANETLSLSHSNGLTDRDAELRPMVQMLGPAEKIKIRQLISSCFSVVNIIQVWLHCAAPFCEFVRPSEYELGLCSANLCLTEKVENKYSWGWPVLFCCGIATCSHNSSIESGRNES